MFNQKIFRWNICLFFFKLKHQKPGLKDFVSSENRKFQDLDLVYEED